MKIFKLTQIGEFHTDHNEDFLVIEEVGESIKLLAVMDGCSSGTDSYFASTMIGKILRKLAKQESYRAFAEKESFGINQLIEIISLQLFEELTDINRRLDLRSDEILSTLILAIVDVKNNKAEILIVGDGVVHSNGKTYEYENDNKPDYIGYHLNMDKRLWFDTKTERRTIDKLEDLTISTDGIYTFKNFDGEHYKEINEEEILHEFFENRSEMDNPNKLKKSLIRIKDTFGVMPSDDLTMIRIINRE